jgi:hypothetical protein
MLHFQVGGQSNELSVEFKAKDFKRKKEKKMITYIEILKCY